jgi:hypothetical protein
MGEGFCELLQCRVSAVESGVFVTIGQVGHSSVHERRCFGGGGDFRGGRGGFLVRGRLFFFVGSLKLPFVYV